MTPEPCECVNWCRDGRDMFSPHHPRCGHYTPPADPACRHCGGGMRHTLLESRCSGCGFVSSMDGCGWPHEGDGDDLRDSPPNMGRADRMGATGPSSDSALSAQVGGGHYKALAIQPAEYCQRNRMPYCESSVVRYVTRHREKNGREDIEKAIHCLRLLLEIEYPQNAEVRHGGPDDTESTSSATRHCLR